MFDSAPGDEGYSSLPSLYLVTWEDEGEGAHDFGEVLETEENGVVTIEKQDVVVNEPFLAWPSGQR